MFGSFSFSWPSSTDGTSILKSAIVVLTSTVSFLATRLVSAQATELDAKLLAEQNTGSIIDGFDAFQAVNEQIYDQTFAQGSLHTIAVPGQWPTAQQEWIANLSIRFDNGSAAPQWLSITPPNTWMQATLVCTFCQSTPVSTLNGSSDFAHAIGNKFYMLSRDATDNYIGSIIVTHEASPDTPDIYPIRQEVSFDNFILWSNWLLKDETTAITFDTNHISSYDLSNLNTITQIKTEPYPFGSLYTDFILDPPTCFIILPAPDQAIIYTVYLLVDQSMGVSALDLSNHTNINQLVSYSTQSVTNTLSRYRKVSLANQALYYSQDYYSNESVPQHSNLYQFDRGHDGNLTSSRLFLNTSATLLSLWPNQYSSMLLTDYHIDVAKDFVYTVNSLYDGSNPHSFALIVYNAANAQTISHINIPSGAWLLPTTLLIDPYLYVFKSDFNGDTQTGTQTLTTISLENALSPALADELALGNQTMLPILTIQNQNYFSTRCVSLAIESSTIPCTQPVTGNTFQGVQIINLVNPGIPYIQQSIALSNLANVVSDDNLLALSSTNTNNPQNAFSLSTIALYWKRQRSEYWQALFAEGFPFTCNSFFHYNKFHYCQSDNALRYINYGQGSWQIVGSPYHIDSTDYHFELLTDCAYACEIHYPVKITVIDKLDTTTIAPVQSVNFGTRWDFVFSEPLFNTKSDLPLFKKFTSQPPLDWLSTEYQTTIQTTQKAVPYKVLATYNDGLVMLAPRDSTPIILFSRINAESGLTILSNITMKAAWFDLTRNGTRLYANYQSTPIIDIIDLSTITSPNTIGSFNWTSPLTSELNEPLLHVSPLSDMGVLVDYDLSNALLHTAFLNFSSPTSISIIPSTTTSLAYPPASPGNTFDYTTTSRLNMYLHSTNFDGCRNGTIAAISLADPASGPTLLSRFNTTTAFCVEAFEEIHPYTNRFLYSKDKAYGRLLLLDTKTRTIAFDLYSLSIDNKPLSINWAFTYNELMFIQGATADSPIKYLGVIEVSGLENSDWLAIFKLSVTTDSMDTKSCAYNTHSLTPVMYDGTHLLLYADLADSLSLCSIEIDYNHFALLSSKIPLSNHELIELTLTAKDAFNQRVDVPLTLGLNNNPPKVNIPLSNHSVNIDDTLSLHVVNAFADQDGDSLTLKANLLGGGSLPKWLNYLSEAQQFFGTPRLADATTLQIELTANDGYGGTVSTHFDLVVNIPPSIANPIQDQVALVGELFNFVFHSDVFASHNQLIYTSKLIDGTPLPSALTFNGQQRRYFSNNTNDITGKLDIELKATDPYEGTISTTFSLSFLVAPEVTSQELHTEILIHDGSLNYQIPHSVFIEGNGEALLLQANCIPHLSKACPINWLFFNPNTARFSGEPPQSSQGVYTLNVSATDPLVAAHFPNNGTVTTLVEIDVPNRAPIVQQAVPTLEAFIWESFTFVLPVTLFVDPDGDFLSIDINEVGKTSLPQWLSYHPESRLLKGTPSLIPWQGDNLNLVARATDPFGATTKSEFQILVSTSAVVKDIAKWYGLSGSGMLICWLIARWYRLHQLNHQKPKLDFLATSKQAGDLVVPPRAAVDINALKKQMGDRYQDVKVCAQNTHTIEISHRVHCFKESVLQYLDASSQHHLSSPLPNILTLASDLLTVVLNMGREMKAIGNAMPWLVNARLLMNFILTNNRALSGWVLKEDKLRLESQLDKLITRSASRGDISHDILHHIELIREALRHMPDDDNWQYIGESKTSFVTHLAKMVAVPPYGAYSFWSEGERTVGSWYTKLLQLETMIESVGHDINVEHIELCQRTLNEENDWRFIYAVIDLLQTIALTDGIDEHVLDQIVTEGHRIGDETLKGLSDLERFEDYLLNRVDCCCLDDRNGQVREKAHIAMDAIRDKYPGRFGGWKEVSFNGMEMTKYHQL